MKRRAKIPPADERMLPLFTAILARGPGVIPPELAEPWREAVDASQHGQKCHRGRKKKQHEWQSVYDMAVAADPAVFRGKIEAERVRAVLATIEQTKDVKRAAAPARDGDSAFIRWVRRGLAKNTLQLPPPLPPSTPHVSVYDSDDPEDM